MIIEKGMVFDTVAEKGCVALSDPDEEGRFLGRDTVGVECEFTTNMVNSARKPEFNVVARLEVHGAELYVTDDIAVSVGLPVSLGLAVQGLRAKSGDLFAMWEAGEERPESDAAEALSQERLPQFVYVYAGGRLWMLDDMYTGVTKSDCRG